MLTAHQHTNARPAQSCAAFLARFVLNVTRTSAGGIDSKMSSRHNIKDWRHPACARAMAIQINSKKVKYFRWHDSGDVQNLDHLRKIFEVCRLTPEIRHWMPTREAWTKDYLNECPENLIIRFSAPMVDQAAPASWPHTSTVSTKPEARTCPAPDQGNSCADCRACWDKSVKNICYGEH